MNCTDGCRQAVPHGLQRVIPERHFRLWILQDHGQGYLLDLHHLVALNAEYAENGWLGWRSATVTANGRQVVWTHGATLDVETLSTELALPPSLSTIRVLSTVRTDELYRPLIRYVPSSDSPDIFADRVAESYNIDLDTLAVLAAEYAAPSALLYRRLVDLTLALGAALSMSEKNVRDLMHWRWQKATRRTAAVWPKPLAAILRGELQYVENTLYPHPPQAGRSG